MSAPKTKREAFALRYHDGSFFTGMTGIGPAFGGTKAQAQRFESRIDAVRTMGTHFAFGDCDLVEVSP